jgi:hypothetical protein
MIQGGRPVVDLGDSGLDQDRRSGGDRRSDQDQHSGQNRRSGRDRRRNIAPPPAGGRWHLSCRECTRHFMGTGKRAARRYELHYRRWHLKLRTP